VRVPLSWLREYADVAASAEQVRDALVRAGLEVERVDRVGAEVSGVVVGEVVEIEELTEFKKPIRWCQVDTGQGPRGVICGATNFAVGDRVPVALPGATLPGGFEIGARPAYGRVSNGMICSERELGLGEDHAGILVLEGAPPLGVDVVEHLGLRDDVLEIAIKADRSYCLSVRGVAREAATAFGVPFRDPAAVDVPAAGDGYPVSVSDTGRCARYVAQIVRGIDPNRPSPRWMQRRLTLAGMRPISLAVDVTNYVLLAVGQPLHAFDLGKLAGPIVVRCAVAGEKIETLDGQVRSLDPDDLLITDDSGPIAMAGVMGGASTEVDATTRDVLIESAQFDPAGVWRSVHRHRLDSEASKRFARGIDDALQPIAAELAARLLAELGGGTADAAVTDVDNRRPRPAITLGVGLATRLGGTSYPPDVVRRRLEDVGCAVDGDDPLAVVPPSWRPDLTLPVDLVEEVLRLEGYDRIPSVLPAAPAGRGLTRHQQLRRGLARAVAEAGYAQTTSYPFIDGAALDALGVPEGDARRRLVRLANPISEQEPYLASTLLPGLLGALHRNVSRGLTDVALFELGPVFIAREHQVAAPTPPVTERPAPDALSALDAALPDQPLHLAVALAGHRERPGWWGPGRAVSWADAVEVARLAAATVRAAGVSVQQAAVAPYHPGRCAQVELDGAVIGHAGELHPRVIEALGLPPRTCAAELDVDALLAAAVEDVKAPEISAYPPATVDVALVVDNAVPAADVETALREGAGELLEDLRLFDLYAGAQVGGGHRSLAYTLRFRAPDRTLTDQEVLAARDAAVASAAARTGAALRA
jgi:phenylalanyl-tRNA synthetase beta chain